MNLKAREQSICRKTKTGKLHKTEQNFFKKEIENIALAERLSNFCLEKALVS